ncbi:MAG: T9SS type A sorting domain-containing protein [Salinivirgaceae bacterium]|nr:T9SS type A sorting domain-containing protein [Salinivirgaceae bacterium]
MKQLLLSFIAIILIINTYGQEVLSGIGGNAILRNIPRSEYKKSRAELPSINLPFVEDFSGTSVFADTARWEDSSAYINNHFAQNFIGIGFATLDAVDSKGYLYKLALGETHRNADFLTSRRINLQYTPADSIYLSFFYQAGGLGDKPELNDSLIVDLHNGTQWNMVWFTKGDITDNNWRQAMIPITDEAYMSESFRFRIRNVISPSSGGVIGTNCDMWNIDFVRLKTGRNINDTVISDISHTKNPNTLLSQYSAIPWKHYKADPYHEHGNVNINFKNHDSISNQITLTYRIKPAVNGDDTPWTNLGTLNYAPFEENDISSPVHNNPFPYTATDSMEYILETRLIGSDNYPGVNTTAKKTHKFSDYYAYDDGTAENGYDVNNQGGQVAVKYETIKGDSLRGAYMYFNPTNDSTHTFNYFSLCVWSDDGGLPGKKIYSKPGFIPTFNQQNQITKLMFDSAIYVTGSFYIGWTKSTNQPLSVGYDRNTRTSQKNFYNLGYQWIQSSYNNAIMIRPILSHDVTTSISDIDLSIEKPIAYPIPTNGTLNITYPDQKKPWQILVTDLSGRTLIQELRPSTIDCSNLTPGIYIITFTEHRQHYYQKIIIQ